MNLKNYTTIKQIYNTGDSEVYQAIDERNGRLVIIKTLKQDYPSPQRHGCLWSVMIKFRNKKREKVSPFVMSCNISILA